MIKTDIPSFRSFLFDGYPKNKYVPKVEAIFDQSSQTGLS